MQSLYADLPQALHRLFETIAANPTLQVLLAFVIIGAVAALLAETSSRELRSFTWQRRHWRRGGGRSVPYKRGAAPVPFGHRGPLGAELTVNRGAGPVTDPAEQLRLVMDARFEQRRLLSRSEAQVLYAAEKAINAAADLKWRVMAQVSLGEILYSPDARAYSAINSKRVDLLIVSRGGDPIAAIEYQGRGHYQGTAAARDAVKKEALRKAGVRYIEVTPESGTENMVREISRIAQAERLRRNPQSSSTPDYDRPNGSASVPLPNAIARPLRD
jgi:hypothetical protein